ncbi:MAG TPA: PIN domain-containing protein [Gemmatimonadales bacterium]
MRAYVDTSCIVSVALDERGSEAVRQRLVQCDELLAGGLLEAELMSALRREGVDVATPPILEHLDWVIPDRHLSTEIARVLSVGYLRGADCWHLATALYLAGDDPASLAFLTLDERQGAAASTLGFGT